MSLTSSSLDNLCHPKTQPCIASEVWRHEEEMLQTDCKQYSKEIDLIAPAVYPPLQGSRITSVDEYLKQLSTLNLETTTIKFLRSITSKISKFCFYNYDCIELGGGKLLLPCELSLGSLNDLPERCKKIFSCQVRTITIQLQQGNIKQFDALVLGRLQIGNIPTFWIVVLDDKQDLWALRANAVDDDEKPELEWDEEEPQPREDLYGPGILAVRLFSLEELLDARKLKQCLPPPMPLKEALSWTSSYTCYELEDGTRVRQNAAE